MRWRKAARSSAPWVAATVLAVLGGLSWQQRRASPAIESRAVLPLVNASGDPDLDYLSDGITESLINSLSRLPGLRVIAGSTVFRYRGQIVDPRAAARELRVEAVFTGRVTQRGENLTSRGVPAAGDGPDSVMGSMALP